MITDKRRPNLSDKGPANGREIKRPSPNAAAMEVTAITSFNPHWLASISFTTC